MYIYIYRIYTYIYIYIYIYIYMYDLIKLWTQNISSINFNQRIICQSTRRMYKHYRSRMNGFKKLTALTPPQI